MLVCARYQAWFFGNRSFGSTVTRTDTNRCRMHTHRHTHIQKEGEAWASLAVMRTGSCHRLSIPCMSPMARNKLVTALPATVLGYLRCTGLCQTPLLPQCCAFAYHCVWVWAEGMRVHTHKKKKRGQISSSVTLPVTSAGPELWVQHFIWSAFSLLREPSLSTRGSRGFKSLPQLPTCTFLLKSDTPSASSLSQLREEWIYYGCLFRPRLHLWHRDRRHVCRSCKVLMHAVIYKHMATTHTFFLTQTPYMLTQTHFLTDCLSPLAPSLI